MSKNSSPNGQEILEEVSEACGDNLNMRERIKKEIESMPMKKFAKTYPKMTARITQALLGDTSGNKTDGFLLEADDPYGLSVERTFVEAGGIPQRVIVRKIADSLIPLVMPYDDPATRTALESYITRAQGAGDTERAAAARMALKKCK